MVARGGFGESCWQVKAPEIEFGQCSCEWRVIFATSPHSHGSAFFVKKPRMTKQESAQASRLSGKLGLKGGFREGRTASSYPRA